MIDPVEKFFEIKVNHDAVAFGNVSLRLGHRLMGGASRSEAVKFNAAVAAGSPTGFWRMSGHPAVQQALRNHYFDSLGLPRLYVSAQA